MGKKIEIGNEYYEKVRSTYEKTKNLRADARAANIDPHSARRILITAGLWSNDKSDKIKVLYDSGKSMTEIADILNTSLSNVYGYLPLTPPNHSKRSDMTYIYKNPNSYYVVFPVDGKRIYLKSFYDLEKAKKVRDEALKAKNDGVFTEWYANYKKNILNPTRT